jgi:hypothetical protein
MKRLPNVATEMALNVLAYNLTRVMNIVGIKPPWSLIRQNSECYVVRDANGVTVAWLFCRDDSQRYSVGASKLTSEEARRIGKAISRIPEFMMQRRGFYPRGGGPRWRPDRPYHVALEDSYIRAPTFYIDHATKRARTPTCFARSMSVPCFPFRNGRRRRLPVSRGLVCNPRNATDERLDTDVL